MNIKLMFFLIAKAL